MTTTLRNAVFDALDGALREDREEKTLACRILMRLCVVDGVLHPAEQVVLDATMARHGLGSDERIRIQAEAVALLDSSAANAAAAADAAIPIEALIARLSAPALTELLVHLEHGAWADGRVVAAETELIDAVRRHLAARG